MLLMLDSETTRERLRGRDAGFEPSLTRLEQQTEGRVYATTRLCARYACVAIYGNDAFNACLSVDPKATCRESALQKKKTCAVLCAEQLDVVESEGGKKLRALQSQVTRSAVVKEGQKQMLQRCGDGKGTVCSQIVASCMQRGDPSKESGRPEEW